MVTSQLGNYPRPGGERKGIAIGSVCMSVCVSVCVSVCLSVRACNSKTIAGIDLQFFLKVGLYGISVLLQDDPQDSAASGNSTQLGARVHSLPIVLFLLKY